MFSAWRDIISALGDISIVVKDSKCTDDICTMHCTCRNALMISLPIHWKTLNALVRSSMHWTPPNALYNHQCIAHTLYKVLWFCKFSSDAPPKAQYTDDIPPMHWWYPPMHWWYPPMHRLYPSNALMISSQCTVDILPMHWTPPMHLILPMHCAHVIQGAWSLSSD